jgi:carbon monoxide dehydrogenase subunit G
VIDYRGAFEFPLPPDALWETLSQPERFPAWWGWWLRDFGIDGDGLVDGAVLHGMVVPPVPYRMRVEVRLERCDRPRRIDALVAGDLRGPAELVLHPVEGGTRAEVAWRVEMMQRAMRVAARMAHPLLRWGHDRVVEATVAGFVRHLRSTGIGPTGGAAPPPLS